MPELPEVETVRRALAPVMENSSFEAVTTNRPDLRFPLPDRFAERLVGARVEHMDRRGKYLAGALSTGETLIMHLGMSGRFTVHNEEGSDNEGEGAKQAGQFHQNVGAQAGHGFIAHTHVVFQLSAGLVSYADPRRFGFMDLVDSAGLDKCRHFAGMGPEPLGNSFSADHLFEAFKGRKTPVKQALLDQRHVAGLGNIYVCEALYRAGISPKRLAGNVGRVRLERLVPEIRTVLRDAIKAGGSSLRDFASTDGELGYFQHTFQVYDREGAPCSTCKTPIKRLIQGGRSTFFCSHCQR